MKWPPLSDPLYTSNGTTITVNSGAEFLINADNPEQWIYNVRVFGLNTGLDMKFSRVPLTAFGPEASAAQAAASKASPEYVLGSTVYPSGDWEWRGRGPYKTLAFKNSGFSPATAQVSWEQGPDPETRAEC